MTTVRIIPMTKEKIKQKVLTPFQERRRRNLEKFFRKYDSLRAFCIAVDEFESSMSAMLSGNAAIGDKRARKYESRLNLEPGSLDKSEHSDYLFYLTAEEVSLINYFRLADDNGKGRILDAGRVISRFDEHIKNAV